jgi:hypothetical protein
MLILPLYTFKQANMKAKSALTILVGILMISLLVSCSRSIEEKLSGEWRASEVIVKDGEDALTREKLDALKRMEKSVVFVLNEDYTMSAVTGGSVIQGVWEFSEETKEVMILFDNSGTNPTLLGKYSGGKITKDHETGGVSVKTVYEKR